MSFISFFCKVFLNQLLALIFGRSRNFSSSRSDLFLLLLPIFIQSCFWGPDAREGSSPVIVIFSRLFSHQPIYLLVIAIISQSFSAQCPFFFLIGLHLYSGSRRISKTRGSLGRSCFDPSRASQSCKGTYRGREGVTSPSSESLSKRLPWRNTPHPSKREIQMDLHAPICLSDGFKTLVVYGGHDLMFVNQGSSKRQMIRCMSTYGVELSGSLMDPTVKSTLVQPVLNDTLPLKLDASIDCSTTLSQGISATWNIDRGIIFRKDRRFTSDRFSFLGQKL